MKTKNSSKKVVVSVLALAMGAGLAGSISGSVAWYQYSTRTTAQLQGVSAGTTRNLQVRLGADGEWKQDLSADDINAYLGVNVTNEENADTDTKPDKLVLNPVTTSTLDGPADTAEAPAEEEPRDKDGALSGTFYGHPVYQYGDLPALASQFDGEEAAKKFNYVTLPLQFKVEDNGKMIEKDIYVVTARFVDISDGDHADITSALRIHFSNGLEGENAKNALLANANADGEYAVSGRLDLNNNGSLDRDDFVGTDDNANAKFINYGNKGANRTGDLVEGDILKQAFYSPSTFLADDSNVYDFDGGISLGKTKEAVAANETQTYLSINVTIWLEGWAELSAHPNVPGTNPAEANETLWDASYIGSDFGLQLRFACEANA